MPRPRSSRSSRRAGSAQRRPTWLKRLLSVVLIVLVMGGLGLATGVGITVAQIPPIDTLLAARPLGATTIHDREGKQIASIQNGENRELVKLGEIAEPMVQSVIASEDSRFYDHFGVDPMGVARAVLSMGQLGGGSTLTQQLAKNLFLTADKNATRKIADMWLAIQLERKLDKKTILEMYLNQVYFGHGAYGVQAAARKYFAKKASALNLSEAAMLTGLLPAPEYYSPYRNFEYAKERQALVLRRMVELGMIDQATADAAAKRKVALANTPDYAYRAPYFVSHVLSLLSDRLGPELVMRGGLKIYTTMDLRMQEQAERLIKQGVAGYKRWNVSQGALVAIEPGTGAVRVLVGGTDFGTSQFNRATQAHRQPGSTFKPFVYLTAFSQGYGPYTTINDAPVSYGAYAPQNYDHRFHGQVTFERALAFSYNIPAVKVANTIGMGNVIQLAHAAGIKSTLPENLSVALGSAEVTPLELTAAYATFGADGVYAEPHLITRVEDKNGNIIDQFPVSAKPVVDAGAVSSLHRCLSGVVTYGSGAAANFGRPAGGKTGTTSENRDTWFAGYTPDLAAVVWLGNDDNSRLASSATGGQLAAPLWRQFMQTAHSGLPVRALIKYRAVEAPEADATPLADDGEVPADGQSPDGSLPTTDPGQTGGIDGQPLGEQLPSEAPLQEPSVAPMQGNDPVAVPSARPPAPSARPAAQDPPPQQPAPVPSLVVIQ
jgi:1A family penicillin-binding protein